MKSLGVKTLSMALSALTCLDVNEEVKLRMSLLFPCSG